MNVKDWGSAVFAKIKKSVVRDAEEIKDILSGKSNAYDLALDAAQEGDLAKLKRAYRYNTDAINTEPKEDKYSCLAIAVRYGHQNCIDFLLKKKVKIAPDQLLDAAYSLNLEVAKLVLKAGINPNTDTQASLLQNLVWGVFRDLTHPELSVEFLELLIKHGFDINNQVHANGLVDLPLHCADQPQIKWLFFVDKLFSLITSDQVITNFFESQKDYVPGELNKPSVRSKDALLLLVKRTNSASLIKYLDKLAFSDAGEAIEYIINKEKPDPSTFTPEIKVVIKKALTNAAANGSYECLVNLVPLSTEQKDLNEALGHAIKASCGKKTVELLLTSGADPSYVFSFSEHYMSMCLDMSRRTVNPLLMFAARQAETFALLVKSGADRDALDVGKTPILSSLIKLASEDVNEVIHSLLKARADIEAMDEDGFKPLYWASKTENVEVMKMLLALGAEYDSGASLKRAHKTGNQEMIALLESYERGVIPSRDELGLENFWAEKMAGILEGNKSADKAAGMFV